MEYKFWEILVNFDIELALIYLVKCSLFLRVFGPWFYSIQLKKYSTDS